MPVSGSAITERTARAETRENKSGLRPARAMRRAVQRARQSRARPLEQRVASDMESRFGHDFSRVRVHPEVSEAESLNARAFTTGQDIFFAPGAYEPDTSSGRELLAHELAHTIQHGDGTPGAWSLSRPGDALECSAERAAAAVSTGALVHAATIAPASAPVGLISRRVASTAREEGTAATPAQDDRESTLESRVDEIVQQLQSDPYDHSGIIRRQVARMSPSLFGEVLARVRSRLTVAQWSVLSQVLEEPLTSEAEADSATPAEPEGERTPHEEDTKAAAETVSEAPAAQEPMSAATTIGEDTATGEQALTDTTAKDPAAALEEHPGPEGPPKTSEVKADDAERAAEEKGPAAPEAAREQPKPAAAGGAGAAAPSAAPGGGPAAEAQPVPVEPEGALAAGGASGPEPDAAVPAGAGEINLETGPAGELEAPSSVGEAPPETGAADEFEESAPPEPETSLTPSAEAAVTPAESIPEAPADLTADLPESDEARDTEGTEAPVQEAAAPATAPPTPPPATTPPGEEAAPTAAESAAAAAAVGAVGPDAQSAEPTASEVDFETDAPVEADEMLGAGPDEPDPALAAPVGDIGADAPAAGGCDAGGGEPPAAEAGNGGGDAGGCGGGGGGGEAPAEPPPEAAAPDVSNADPAQAMGSIRSLPPVAMQQALGGVSQAATRAVDKQRTELATNPPQMERPSGVPAQRDPALPVAPVQPSSATGPDSVERAATGAAIPVPQPDPLPPPPANPTERAAAPQLPGDAELSEQDVARTQAAVRNLPVTDPALDVTAGKPPVIELAGDADPDQVKDQHAKLLESTQGARQQGQQDAAEPLGENNVYPTVPQETLKAQPSAEGLGVGGALAACAKGGGKALAEAQANAGGPATGKAGAGGAADPEAVSIVAQEQRGPEIQGAVAQAQGDMVSRQEEQATKIADEKQKSQEQIDQLVQDNAAQQKDERTKARQDSIQLRTEWDTGQRALVGDARRDAATVAADTGTKVAAEQAEGNRKAAGHIETGNLEVASARRDAEEKAGRERERAEEKSSGFFGWLSSKVSAFFNAIKEAIQTAFEYARKLVKKAIEAAKKLAVAAIEAARKVVVGVIRAAGDALMAIGDVVLVGFPDLRDRFRKNVRDRVDRAVNTVNQLADDLKAGVQKLLDALGNAINGLLGLLECAYLAAVDVVAGVVKGAIEFADKVVQALGTFARLIKDIAGDPIGWIKKLGSAVVDGIKNCLWGAFKKAVKNWFNSKLEEVLGLGIAIWKLLFKGCMKLADIGKIVWQALLTAIPIALIQILVEKLVAMIVPAAGAVLVIIEGLRAAWPTIGRIITAFALFFAFLKAVKGGGAAGKFAAAVAAAAVVVIDFVANWLLMRLRKPASAVGGRLKALAQKIGKTLKAGAGAAKRGVKVAAGAMKRGVHATGRGLKRGAATARRAVGRAVAKSKALGAIARSKVGRQLARGVRTVKALGVRGRAAFRQGKERLKAWWKRRKQERERRKAEKRAKARAKTIEALERMLSSGGVNSLRFRGQLTWLKFRWGWKSLRVIPTGKNRFAVEGVMSPGDPLVGEIVQNMEVIPGGFTVSVKGGGEATFVVGKEQVKSPAIVKAFERARMTPTVGQPKHAKKAWQELEEGAQAQFATTVAGPEGLTVAPPSERAMQTEWHIPREAGEPGTKGTPESGFVKPEALGRREHPETGELELVAVAEATLVADIRAQGKYAKGAMRKQGQFRGYLSAIRRELAERGGAGKVQIHVHYYSDREPPDEAKTLFGAEMREAGLANVTVFWHIV